MAPSKPPTKTAPKGPVRAPSKKVAPNPIKTRKVKAQKPCKQIFLGMSFSCSGNFGEGWEHDRMAMWVRKHGGVWESEVSNDTTHLICTVEDYKRKTQQVRKAWARGPQCNIVVRDWLEDCLPHVEKKKRARPEKGYTLDRVLKRVNQSHEAQQRYRKSFEGGVRAGHELVDNNLHHVYYDDDGFEYKIVCTRINDSGRAKSEKYTIYFFESNAKPCTFMVGAKLTSPGRPASYWRDECHPKLFDAAFQAFKNFFRHTTGINWDDRCDGLPHDESKFKYHAPLLGRPVGRLPADKKPPGFLKEDAAVEGENEDADVEMTDVTEEGLIYDTDSEVEDEYDTESSTPKSKSSSKSSRSIISISSSGSSDGDDSSLFDSSLFEPQSYTQPIMKNNTTRLSKPFRSGWGMPAYDRHFVNMPKRYVLPRSDSTNTWDSSTTNEKRPLMTEERSKCLSISNEDSQNSLTKKTIGILRKSFCWLCLEPTVSNEDKLKLRAED